MPKALSHCYEMSPQLSLILELQWRPVWKRRMGSNEKNTWYLRSLEGGNFLLKKQILERKKYMKLTDRLRFTIK